MKKLTSFLLTALIATSLSGCGKKGGGETNSFGGYDNDEDNPYLVEDEFDKDGKLIIQYFAIDLDTLQSQTDGTRQIISYIEDKFQVKFEFLTGTSSSWENVLNQYIGGGDVPDIFFHNKSEPAYSTWLKDKYLFNYSQFIEDYPNLKEAFERYDVKALKNLLGGDYYGYPIVMDSNTESDIINEHALYYRRDWYTNLKKDNWKPSSGRELVDPEDPNFNYLNFYDLCEGYTNGDPDGNGKDDTYGYALTKDGGVYWWYPILSLFDVTFDGWHYNEVDEKWEPDCTSDAMKEAVMFLADMYDKGFINSNYATTCTQANMKNEFVTGQAGMMTYNATYPMGQGVLDLMASFTKNGLALNEVVRGMPVPTGKDGTKHMFGYANRYGYNSINNDVTNNKKKKIMSIMDWMLSDEGQMVLNYGIEGTHYTLNSDGSVKSLLGNDQHGYPKTLYSSDVAPGAYRIKGLVSWSTEIPTFINYYEEQMQLLQAWDRELLKPNPLAYCSVDADYALTISGLEDDIEKAYKAIVTKVSGDAASKRNNTWNDFVKSYKVKANSYINAMNDSALELNIIEG